MTNVQNFLPYILVPYLSIIFVTIGVFHGVAGVARATPGLMELPSTGKGIEGSR